MIGNQRLNDLKFLFSKLNAGELISFAATLVIDQVVLVGHAVGPEEAYGAIVPLDEFIVLCLYFARRMMATAAKLKVPLEVDIKRRKFVFED
jgi:hypothetical protein